MKDLLTTVMQGTMVKTSPILKKAIEEAKLSLHHHKVGAVIFKGKRIIASAHNEVRANKVPNKWKNFYESAHAEAKVIIDARRDLRGYSILVVRINKHGDLMLAKPCEYCEGFIKHVSLRCYYSDGNEIIKLTDNISV